MDARLVTVVLHAQEAINGPLVYRHPSPSVYERRGQTAARLEYGPTLLGAGFRKHLAQALLEGEAGSSPHVYEVELRQIGKGRPRTPNLDAIGWASGLAHQHLSVFVGFGAQVL